MILVLVFVFIFLCAAPQTHSLYVNTKLILQNSPLSTNLRNMSCEISSATVLRTTGGRHSKLLQV